MRLLVSGDRNWTNWRFIYKYLDGFHTVYPISVLIEGEAKGVDSFARNWAKDRGIPYDPYPAQWHRFRHAAGPIRNQQMLDEGQPDMVLAFHNDIENSKGTKDMVTRAEKANIPTIVITEGKDERNRSKVSNNPQIPDK